MRPMIEGLPCTQAAAGARDMKVWTLVGELVKPLYGHQPIPALTALRIVGAHCLKQKADPDETLDLLIGDSRATLAQKPVPMN